LGNQFGQNLYESWKKDGWPQLCEPLLPHAA
jgi:hypothetical protein